MKKKVTKPLSEDSNSIKYQKSNVTNIKQWYWM